MGYCGSLLFIRNRFLTFVEYIFLTADLRETLIIRNYENDLFIYLHRGTLDEFLCDFEKECLEGGSKRPARAFGCENF